MKIILKPEIIKNEIATRLRDVFDIVFLTRIGNTWPMIRAHSVLNNLHSVTAKLSLNSNQLMCSVTVARSTASCRAGTEITFVAAITIPSDPLLFICLAGTPAIETPFS